MSTRDYQYGEGVSTRELTCVNRLSCSVITATLCQPNHCITTAMKEATKASEGTVLKKSGYCTWSDSTASVDPGEIYRGRYNGTRGPGGMTVVWHLLEPDCSTV